jgi:hypothetical protein
LQVASGLPVLGARLSADVQRNRATQAYWQKDYAALVSGPFAPTADETSATLLLLSANAAFRQVVAREKTGTPAIGTPPTTTSSSRGSAAPSPAGGPAAPPNPKRAASRANRVNRRRAPGRVIST